MERDNGDRRRGYKVGRWMKCALGLLLFAFASHSLQAQGLSTFSTDVRKEASDESLKSQDDILSRLSMLSIQLSIEVEKSQADLIALKSSLEESKLALQSLEILLSEAQKKYNDVERQASFFKVTTSIFIVSTLVSVVWCIVGATN